ncbi:MAG: AI-2E family transporter [Geitlerinemataceae cyanobacterium]
MSQERDRLFQLLRRGLLLPICFLNGWLLAIAIDRLDPLVGNAAAAVLLAFILDYPIAFLQRRGLRRGVAIAVVFAVAIAAIAVLAVGVVPSIVNELRDLIRDLPRWLDVGTARLAALERWINETELPVDLDLDIDSAITQAVTRLTAVLQSLSGQVLSLLTRALSGLFDFLTIVVIAMFLVFGGQQLWDGVFSRVPPHWRFVRPMLRKTFQDYFVGQATLATLQSVVMVAIFAVMQVPYALLFGLTIGLTTLVPYAGAVSTVGVAIVLAFQSPGLAIQVAIVSIVIGQIIDTVISPRIVGDATGLNPVWPIVALLVGANLAGFLGLLLAVPTASFIKRLTDRLLDDPPRPLHVPTISPVSIAASVLPTPCDSAETAAVREIPPTPDDIAPPQETPSTPSEEEPPLPDSPASR